MTCFVCVTCGTQFAESATPPDLCAICSEERQYVRWDGQAWTTLEAIRTTHTLTLAPEGEGVTGIAVAPAFGIGHRALLIQTPAGNVLWDCVSLIDDAAVAGIRALGGLTAIAISHPHYYTAMVEWSAAFGDIPIHLHADDRSWVMRPDRRIAFWSGETMVPAPGLTLIRCGGHFAGASVLHWQDGAGGKGAVFAGDVISVNLDRKSVSFMYSYPNHIPLNASAVRRIAASMAPYRFETIYGPFTNRNVATEARARFDHSVARYLKAIAD